MGLLGISKSQVSKLCKEIDERNTVLPHRATTACCSADPGTFNPGGGRRPERSSRAAGSGRLLLRRRTLPRFRWRSSSASLRRDFWLRSAAENRGTDTLAEIRKFTGGGTDFALETSAVP